jgi:hypothetical protein
MAQRQQENKNQAQEENRQGAQKQQDPKERER